MYLLVLFFSTLKTILKTMLQTPTLETTAGTSEQCQEEEIVRLTTLTTSKNIAKDSPNQV